MTKPDDIEQKHWDAARKAIAEQSKGESLSEVVARAIQSAANAAAPKVKPLVWWDHFAHTDMSLFYYLVPDGDGIVLEKILGSATLKSFHGTEHEAKAAAQADYEQRILSALEEPTP